MPPLRPHRTLQFRGRKINAREGSALCTTCAAGVGAGADVLFLVSTASPRRRKLPQEFEWSSVLFHKVLGALSMLAGLRHMTNTCCCAVCVAVGGYFLFLDRLKGENGRTVSQNAPRPHSKGPGAPCYARKTVTPRGGRVVALFRCSASRSKYIQEQK